MRKETTTNWQSHNDTYHIRFMITLLRLLAAAGPARNTPGGFIELNRMTPSAPPPYSRGGYQLFTVQNGVQQNPNNDKNSSVAYNNNTGETYLIIHYKI